MNVMTCRFRAGLLILPLLGSPLVLAAQEVGLFYSPRVPQLAFAASEIRAAAQTKGMKCSDKALAEFSKASQPVRIVLASSETEARELVAAGAAPLKSGASAESYTISQNTDGRRKTYFVIGADPFGAMYGGLDVAEALRIGTLDQLRAGQQTP